MAKKILALLKQNPALASGLFSIAITLAARWGLNLDATQVTLLASVLSVVLGITVHAVTVPASKGDHGKPGGGT
jgi:uncharacterized membrane protein